MKLHAPSPGSRLVVPDVPKVLPRLALGAAALFFALVAPLYAVPILVLGAGVVLWRADPAVQRAAGWLGLMTLIATLTVLPLSLVLFLAELTWAQAYAVAAALALRLAAAGFVGIALVTTLPPRPWLVALRRSPRIAVVLAVTFRQVPEVAADVARIRAAQRARGLLAGPRRYRPLPLLVPLVTRALERADRMGRALVLAGWGSGTPRPLLRARFRPLDLLPVAGAVILVVATYLLPSLNVT